MVEVRKTQKGLNVLDLMRLRPVLNCLDLLRGHGEPRGRELVAKVLGRVSGPFTFLRFGVKSVLAESREDILDMLLVGGLVLTLSIEPSLWAQRVLSQSTGEMMKHEYDDKKHLSPECECY